MVLEIDMSPEAMRARAAEHKRRAQEILDLYHKAQADKVELPFELRQIVTLDDFGRYWTEAFPKMMARFQPPTPKPKE